MKKKGAAFQMSAQEEEEERILDELRYMDLPDEGSEIQNFESAENLSVKGKRAFFDRVRSSLTRPKRTGSSGLEPQSTAPVDPFGPDSVPQAVRVHYTFPTDTVTSTEPSVPPEIRDLGHRLGLNDDADMPRTRKQHQVIEHTAKFIFKHGHK